MTLKSLAALAFMVGALGNLVSNSALADNPECKKWLFNQNAFAQCVGTWLTPCQPCCSHWHEAMSWKTALTDAARTNKKKGSPTTKHYTMVLGVCNGTTCTQGAGQTCPIHTEQDDKLVDCQVGVLAQAAVMRVRALRTGVAVLSAATIGWMLTGWGIDSSPPQSGQPNGELSQSDVMPVPVERLSARSAVVHTESEQRREAALSKGDAEVLDCWHSSKTAEDALLCAEDVCRRGYCTPSTISRILCDSTPDHSGIRTAIYAAALRHWSHTGPVVEYLVDSQPCAGWRVDEILKGALKLLASLDPEAYSTLRSWVTPELMFSESSGLALISLATAFAYQGDQDAIQMLMSGTLGSYGGSADQVCRALQCCWPLLLESPDVLLGHISDIRDSPVLPAGLDQTVFGATIASVICWPDVAGIMTGAERAELLRALMADERFGQGVAFQLYFEMGLSPPPLGFETDEWIVLWETAHQVAIEAGAAD